MTSLPEADRTGHRTLFAIQSGELNLELDYPILVLKLLHLHLLLDDKCPFCSSKFHLLMFHLDIHQLDGV